MTLIAGQQLGRVPPLPKRCSCRQAAKTNEAKAGDYSKGFSSICRTKCFLTFVSTLRGSGSKASNDLISLNVPRRQQAQPTGKHGGLLREGLSSGDHGLLPLHPVSRVWVWIGWASWLPRSEGRGTPQRLGPSGPPSLGEGLQQWYWEHWRHWFFFFLILQLFEAYLTHNSEVKKWSCSVVSDSLRPHGQ